MSVELGATNAYDDQARNGKVYCENGGSAVESAIWIIRAAHAAEQNRTKLAATEDGTDWCGKKTTTGDPA